LTPRGGRSSARIASITCCWRRRLSSLIPNARLAVVRSAVITACEKYGGTAASSARIASRLLADCSVRNRSGSDNAGHSSARPQPFDAR
jgi:hypothetical protein